MTTVQKRDNAYYDEQLRRTKPAIYRDFLAGKYRSLREALIAAGIKKPRTRLHELKNAWSKATPTEQRNFARWLRVEIGGRATARGTGRGALPTIAVERRLEAWTTSRVRAIMAARHLSMGDVMDELGFSRLNASLGRALARGDRLQPDVLIALEKWLVTNKGA